ncbi:70 kDa heat shock protein 1, partial [Cryphonectria parasitica EP155]
MGFSIGIDIGTANTRVAVFRNGRPEIIPDADGRHSMPSYVAFTERCRLFGSAAKAQATSHPENTVYGVKRILGQHLDQVQVSRYTRASSNHPQENNGQITISVGYKKRSHHLSPVQVFAMLVARARANAEAYLGEPVYNAAISVPAYFNNSQREDVRDAVLLGGVNLLYMGTSIESIALYHAFINRQEGERLTLFLDLGASFFNAGLALIEEGIIEMVSCASDNDLGTEDFVDRLHKHFAAEIQRKWGWDIKDDLRAKRRLRVACEVAMRDLSSIASTEVYIDSLYDGQDFSGTITRIRLEELCHDLFRSTFQPIQRVLADAKRDKSLVMDIVIVGGGSRIPKLQKMWSDYFGSKPLVKTVNPDEGEVLGSSIYADIFSGYVYSLRDLLVLPILPISIGFETRRGMFKIVPRNKTCPTTKIESHSLYELNFGPSDRPTLRFYQGERVRVKDNLLIGTLDLAELP